MKTIHRPFRRKFLLLETPPRLKALKSVQIEQGTITRYHDRSLRLRRIGKKHYLSFREKPSQRTLPKQKELLITKSEFEALWPFTEGERMTRQRYYFTLQKQLAKIDCFLGEHTSLEIVDVFFPTLAASKAFKKPDFFGEEVTHSPEYSAEEIALFGIPETKESSQIGILPYLFQEKKLHILLVTNSSKTRWILPKGRQENEMTPHEVATMEAVEEGGILGTLRQDLRMRCQMENGRFLHLYPMKISKLLDSWPEKNLRSRQLLPVTEAFKRLNDKKVARAAKLLTKQLRP